MPIPSSYINTFFCKKGIMRIFFKITIIHLSVNGYDEPAGIQYVDQLMFTYTNRWSKVQKKIDLETDFSSDSDYYEFANEIPFMGNILQPFSQLPKYKLKILSWL